MAAKSPLSQATRMVGIRVNGTRYSRAGWAEFIRNLEYSACQGFNYKEMSEDCYSVTGVIFKIQF